MGAGEQITLGIVIDVDASGVVRGASLAKNAIDNTTQAAQNASSRLQNHMYGIGQGLRIMSRGVAVAGGALVGLGEITRRGILSPAIQEFEDYNLQATQLEMVSGRVGSEFEQMRDIAFQMGMETKFSIGQATESMRLLRQAGLSAAEAGRALRPVLDFSTISAGTVDHVQAVQALAPAYQKLRNSSGESFREILDSFALMSRETNLQPTNMAPMVNSLGALADRAHLSSVEMFALGGVLRNQGELSAEAGQHLAQLHRRLIDLETRRGIYSDPEGRVRGGRRMMMARLEAMRDLDIQMFEGGRQRRYADVIRDIIRGLEGLETEQERVQKAQLLFGPQALRVLDAIRNYEYEGRRGSEALELLFQRGSEAAGESERQVGLVNQSLKGMKDLALGAWKAVGTLLGEGLMPLLEPAIYYFWQLGQKISDLLRQFPILRSVISFAILSFVVLTITAGTLTLALAGMLMIAASAAGGFAALTYAVGGTTAAITVLETVLLPFLAIAAVLGIGLMAALVAVGIGIGIVVYAYMKNLGGFGDWVDSWVEKVSVLWSALTDFFGEGNQQNITENLYQRLRDVGMDKVFLGIVGFIRRVQETWYGMVDVFKVSLKIISGILDVVFGIAIWVFEKIEWALSKLGYKFDENMDYWRALGWVIGVVVVVGVLGLVAAIMALSGAFILLVGILLIGALPTFLTIAIGLATVWGVLVAGLYILDLIKDGFAAAWKEVSSIDAVQNLMASIELYYHMLEMAMLKLGNKLDAVWETYLNGWKLRILSILIPLFDGLAVLFSLFNPATLWSQLFDVEIDVSSITNALSSLFNGIVENFTSMKRLFEKAGEKLVRAFSTGISYAWSDFISGFQTNLAVLRSLLPSSDAETGPLSTLTQSGSSLVETFQTGVMSAMPNFINSFTQGISGIAGILGIGPSPTEGKSGGIGAGISPLSPIQSIVNTFTGAGGAEKGSKSVTVSIGEITVQVQQASQEEAERFVDIVMNRIRSEMDMETERSFA